MNILVSRPAPRITYRSRYGKAFEAEIRNSLKYYQDLSRGELYWFRLMDFMDFYSIHPNMQARHQPGDFLFVRQGVAFLIECKCTISTSFPFEFVSDNQMGSGESWTRAGGRSYLIIKHDLRREGERSRVYAVTMKDYLVLRSRLLSAGHKSVKWEALAQVSKELQEMKARTWCLATLWETARTYTLSQLG